MSLSSSCTIVFIFTVLISFMQCMNSVLHWTLITFAPLSCSSLFISFAFFLSFFFPSLLPYILFLPPSFPLFFFLLSFLFVFSSLQSITHTQVWCTEHMKVCPLLHLFKIPLAILSLLFNRQNDTWILIF